MRTWLLEFLSMTTNTLLASWFAGINRVCVVCCANLRGRTSLSLMIWRRKLFYVPTNISAVFAAKRASRPGFIGSPITAFGNTHGVEKSSLGSTKSNCRGSTIHMLSTPV